MDENVLRKIKKIKALAERGVGGEKSTAEQKLKKLRVPPEKINLKLQLFFRLCVHMTEQQDKIIASSEVNGLITNI